LATPFGAEKLFLLTAVDSQIFRFPTLHVGGWRMGILGFNSKRFDDVETISKKAVKCGMLGYLKEKHKTN